MDMYERVCTYDGPDYLSEESKSNIKIYFQIFGISANQRRKTRQRNIRTMQSNDFSFFYY